MGMFKDMLKDSETLFKNEIALDYSFIPKLIPYRESQQKFIAECIKPLFQDRNGKNVMLFGSPGVGKTVAVKHIFKELEEETDDIVPIFINCWQKNTTFKIVADICEQLDYKLTHNKKTEELFAIVKNMLNKKAAVFCFDEVDKIEDISFLYTILEEIYKKTIILITNYKSWIDELDERIKSRLMVELVEFKAYNSAETKGILKQRTGYAFQPGVLEDDAFELISAKTFELQDIRSGLYMMREAAIAAENESSRKILQKHAEEAVKKLDDYHIKSSGDLTDDEKKILHIIKKNSGKKGGEVYLVYKESGGESVYKSFMRKVKRLEDMKFVEVEKTKGGKEGNVSIIKYKEVEKKLSDY